jgi:hypothetical protein
MNRRCGRHWLVFGLTIAAVAIVWTVVLPWFGERQLMRGRIDFLQGQGIDPSALYYTDLEAMGRLESNLAALRHAHPEAFWRIKPADHSTFRRAPNDPVPR